MQRDRLSGVHWGGAPVWRVVRGLSVALLLGAALVGVGTSCGEATVRRDCFARIWVPHGRGYTGVAGDFSDWEPVVPFQHDADWDLVRLDLPAGDYGYTLLRGDAPRLDPSNPLTTFRNSGEEVSLLIVEDCARPAIKVERVEVSDQGAVTLEGRFLAARSGASIDEGGIRATAAGEALQVSAVDPETSTFRVEAELPRGAHTIELTATDAEGAPSEVARVRAFPGRLAETREDEVLYQVVVDRFRASDGSPLPPPPTAGARAGGTLDGVRTALTDGTFERLGVTTLWLSPVYDNPDEERPGRDGRMYQGYHGYWVEDGRRVEPVIGGEEALHALLDEAHRRGIAVLLDLVPNHVADSNRVVKEHEGDGWFNPEGCVCGTPECPWSSFLQVCWFTDYLPDLHLQDRDVMKHATDEAAFWLEGTGADGVRIDAVPMMPRAATRRIAHRLRDTVAGGEEPFVIGEVFTGPGVAALEEIRAQIGPAGLDGAFSFPLMWSLRGAIASGAGSFADVDAMLDAEEDRFAGSGVVLGRILDNHDVSRFVSNANGDDAGDAWDDPAAQPEDDGPYLRLGVGLAAIFTLPGMPTVFQGDEIGLAGSGDPDNRRVMPAEEALLPAQRVVREQAERLGALRRCSVTLRRGERRTLAAEPRRWAYVRETEGEPTVLVVLAAGDASSEIEVVLPDLAGATVVDALSGEAFVADAGGVLSIAMEPVAARVLLAEGDPCLVGPSP